jgi:hypothetical protein
MNKIVLMLFLCMSLQGCSVLGSFFGGDSTPEIPPILGGKPKEEKKDKNGLLAITEFMAVMTLLKTQVD